MIAFSDTNFESTFELMKNTTVDGSFCRVTIYLSSVYFNTIEKVTK